MTYKNKADAKSMADYYAKKVDKEAEKLVLIEKSIRERILVVLNKNELTNKSIRDAIKTDIEILDEIDEDLTCYRKCRDEANDEAKKYECEEEAKQ